MARRTLAFLFALACPAFAMNQSVAEPSPPPAPSGTAVRLPGPGGSLVMVEENRATALVEIVIATRTGAARDPRHLDGLANLSSEVARRSAGGRSRAQIDDALDALGARLDVITDFDTVQLTGHVLAKHLDAYLAIVADVVLRPDFAADEIDRTRREVLAQIDEMRNDDRALAGRFFARRLYGRHGYGHAIDGTRDSLSRITRADLERQHRKTFTGQNLVFAATGAIAPDDLRARLEHVFAGLPAGAPPAAEPAPPPGPQGWRIELVDKPDRKQVQIMFGHLGLPATHPEHLALSLAIASFGGSFMNATLLSQVRVERGLAYGAYMRQVRQRGAGPLRAWLSTGVDRTVEALKLSLRLFGELADDGVSPERLAFVQDYLVGSYAAQTDSPAQRLAARVAAELHGMPPDFVDAYPALVRAITPEQVALAVRKHLHPKDLAITLVASADVLVPLLIAAKVDRNAIDVVPYDSF